MSNERVDAFANISLGDFKPKGDDQRPADAAVIEKVSQKNNFPSREAPAAKPEKRARFSPAAPRKQLNLKVSEDCYQRFYDMAESRGIRVLGDLLALALEALDRESADEESNHKSRG